MLEEEVIHPNASPYSSLVLLIYKKDSSWCMCIKFWDLNKITIKDKFTIHIIDEILDELHCVKYFSKLDIRSRYHQIRLHDEDITKTTFIIHEGYYEFIVMPFLLTDAPSTFQSLMNHVFHPYL